MFDIPHGVLIVLKHCEFVKVNCYSVVKVYTRNYSFSFPTDFTLYFKTGQRLVWAVKQGFGDTWDVMPCVVVDSLE
jgi:hypothetical protein